MMSGHRVRSDLAGVEISQISDVDGGLLEDRDIWGFVHLLKGVNPTETRTLVEPSTPGQRLVLNCIEVGTSITVSAPAGTDFDGAGGDEALFNAVGDILVIESFYSTATQLSWRAVYNNSVTVS